MRRYPLTCLTSCYALLTLSMLPAGPSAQAAGRVSAWGLDTDGQCHPPVGLNNVKAVAAGSYHSLALRADGTVVGWGDNDSGKATPPEGLNGVIGIAGGYRHSVALLADGTVIAWGVNEFGTTNVPAGLSNVVAVAAGGYDTIALRADGTVTAWGYNYQGNANALSDLSNITAIVSGGLALRMDGTVHSWGPSAYGVAAVPVGLSNVTEIASSGSHALALRSDGTVVAWGSGWHGEMNVPSGLSNVVAVAAGGTASYALRADGTVVAWGELDSGRTQITAGLNGVAAISAGQGHVIAITAEGQPEIHSEPADTQVLMGTNLALTVVATGHAPLNYQWFRSGLALTNSESISGAMSATLVITNVQYADVGTYTVVVSDAFGSASSIGAYVDVVGPPLIVIHPQDQTVRTGSNVVVSVGVIGRPSWTYRWFKDGDLMAGNMGPAIAIPDAQPYQTGSYWVTVSNVYGVVTSSPARITINESEPYILAEPRDRTGPISGSATLSVTARGSPPLAYQWRHEGQDVPGATNAIFTVTNVNPGHAGYYSVQIGNTLGSVVSRKAYLSVSQVLVWGETSSLDLTNYPPGLTNVIAVAAGDSFVLALKSDGRVVGWGRSVPWNLTNVVKIAAGPAHGLALRANGTVVWWSMIRAGNTNLLASLTNVVDIAAGETHSAALRRDGTITTWGDLDPWRSGGVTNIVTGLSDVVAIATGRSRTLALRANGRVAAWGNLYTTNTPDAVTNVIAIACGRRMLSSKSFVVSVDEYNYALRADGTIVAWTYGSATSSPRHSVWSAESNSVAMAASLMAASLRANGSVASGIPPGWPSSAGPSNVTAIAAGMTVGTIRSSPFPIDPWWYYTIGPVPFFAVVIGDGSPSFTLQPATQSVLPGTEVRLHARAVSQSTVHYQWQLSGTNISGATNATFIISEFQPEQIGVYRAVASNALGVVVSSNAVVTISTSLPIALNAPELAWATGSSPADPQKAWFPQFTSSRDGEAAGQSGPISHGEQTWLHATVQGPGTLTFWWKVSCEPTFDRLWFTMDALNWADWITGETDWEQFEFRVPPGEHVLRWAYTKDGNVSVGQDAGWVDQVVFTPDSLDPFLQRLSVPTIAEDGSVVITAQRMDGTPFVVDELATLEAQVSTNLPDWMPLSGTLTLSNGVLSLRDPTTSNSLQRYYRVVEH